MATEFTITMRISKRTPKLKKQFEKHCKKLNTSVNKRLQQLMYDDVIEPRKALKDLNYVYLTAAYDTMKLAHKKTKPVKTH